jgi:glycosyltransferase involved in cell wall biosynthesis
MQKILIIGYVWPEPNSSAAGRHMMSILRLFRQQNWQLEFVSPAQQTEHMIDLASEGISSRAIELNNASFDKYIEQYQPDIVLFDRFMMEEQFGWRVERACPNALRILDTEDLQCLRYARQHAHKANRKVIESDFVNDIAKREIAAILRCDLSLIISSEEMQLLTERYKVDTSLLHYLPFMVDLSTLPAQTRDFEQRQHFMTIGNFRHAPNWDLVLYLQSIWPLIRQRLPKAELHIYGAYPPPKATALTNVKTGFIVKGWAEDAYEVIEKARVCLAPIRFGAGIKGKLLDAMMMQTPSVTTSVGREGMGNNDQHWSGIIADDVDSFVEAAVTLYTDEPLWREAQHHGLTILEHQFDRNKLAHGLLSKINDLQACLEKHRLNNFTGAMLRHHTMTSTKYMSQWIELKNKRVED